MMHGCDSAHPFVQDANMHECTWFAACPFSHKSSIQWSHRVQYEIALQHCIY